MSRREARQLRAEQASPPRRRRRWPWAVGVPLALAAVVLAVAGVLAVQAMAVKNDLEAARAAIGSLPDAVRAGDSQAIDAAADAATRYAGRAAGTVTGPLWDAAATVPGIGANVAAVQAATEATNILVRDALPPATSLLAAVDLNNLTLEGGGIDLAPFRDAQSTLPTVNDAFAQAKSKVDLIDRDALLPPVDAALGQLIDVVNQAAPAVDQLEKYLPTLLKVAGDGERRNYMIIFQNTAEARASGGSPSASIRLVVDNGKFEFQEQESSDTYYQTGLAGESFLKLPGETTEIYESDFTRFSQNYTRTPDFPTTAALFGALQDASGAEPLDGVISIDPTVLSYMLAATGPIQVSDGGWIDSENVVRILLSDTYERFGIDGLAADAYFSEVTDGVFSTLIGGRWDPVVMLRQLQRGVEEGRIKLWFADPDAEQMSAELGADGQLTTDNSTKTQVGLYVNDAAYSKLEYYLTTSVAMTCDAQARTATVSLTINNGVPRSDLSGWTLGWRNEGLGLPRTSMILDVVAFAPPGGSVSWVDPTTSDIRGWNREGIEKGHPASSRTVVIPMGESREVTTTFDIPADASSPLELGYTRTASNPEVTVDGSCAALFPQR